MYAPSLLPLLLAIAPFTNCIISIITRNLSRKPLQWPKASSGSSSICSGCGAAASQGGHRPDISCLLCITPGAAARPRVKQRRVLGTSLRGIPARSSPHLGWTRPARCPVSLPSPPPSRQARRAGAQSPPRIRRPGPGLSWRRGASRGASPGRAGSRRPRRRRTRCG